MENGYRKTHPPVRSAPFPSRKQKPGLLQKNLRQTRILFFIPGR